MPHLSAVTLVVPDYDVALNFYVCAAGFELIEDTELAPGKRWVLIAPRGAQEARLLLARADGPAQAAAVGNQTGGRVGFFLMTGDFDADHKRMLEASATFLESPRSEPYGKVAVWQDPFGNKWDLLEQRQDPPPVPEPSFVAQHDKPDRARPRRARS